MDLEYQNDVFAEKFFDTGEVDSVCAYTEPETADQEYEKDNQEYEYIKLPDIRMRKLPEVGVKTDSVLFAFQSGQWRDISRRPFIAFSFLMVLSLILAITALVLACLRCSAQCPNGWKKLGKKCYHFSSETKKWEDARKHCQNMGADLVVINSERERTFLNYKMNKAYWIGLSYEKDKRAWKWVNDGSDFYSNWDRNLSPEKSETGHGKYCVVSNEHRTWSSIECQYRYGFICEKYRHVACVLSSPFLPL